MTKGVVQMLKQLFGKISDETNSHRHPKEARKISFTKEVLNTRRCGQSYMYPTLIFERYQMTRTTIRYPKKEKIFLIN